MCYFCTHAHKILLQRKDKLRTVHPIQLYNTKKFINFFFMVLYYTKKKSSFYDISQIYIYIYIYIYKKELRVLRFIVALSDFSH